METYTHAGNYNNYLDGCMNEQGREPLGEGAEKVLSSVHLAAGQPASGACQECSYNQM